jgi:hypothetical protein
MFRLWRMGVALLCTSVSLTGSQWGESRADVPEDVDVVLRAYEAANAAWSHASFTVTDSIAYNGPVAAAWEDVGKSETHCAIDGDRWHVRQEEIGRSFFSGAWHEWSNEFEFVVTRQGSVYIQGGDAVSVQGSVDPEKSLPGHTYLRHAATILGFVPGDPEMRMLDVLRGSKPRISAAMIDGKHVQLLESETKFGDFRLWCDTGAGGLPRRIEVYRAGTDIDSAGRSIADAAIPQPGGMLPAAKLESLQVVVDAVRIEEFSGRHAITGLRQSLIYTYPDGVSATFRHQLELADVQFSPPFDESAFQVRMSVPEGTSVTMSDAGGIQYRWQDGWPRKFVDRGALPPATSDEFKPGRRYSLQSIVIFCGAILGVGVASWITLRRIAAAR